MTLAIPLEKALVLREKGALLIDARSPAEFAEATIPGASKRLAVLGSGLFLPRSPLLLSRCLPPDHPGLPRLWFSAGVAECAVGP